jgi:energy-coupling factor transporter ATP-binding protein EcfA2
MHRLNINPNKGLLIMGPVGCGKTEIMSMLKKFIKPGIKDEYVYDIMANYNAEGDRALKPFRHGPIHSATGKPIECLFDDLGVDRPSNHFGNRILIGQDLIYIRHLLFKKTRAKSHFTTNLNVEELTEYYKDISRSRLREMCNVIQYPKDAPDLRF